MRSSLLTSAVLACLLCAGSAAAQSPSPAEPSAPPQQASPQPAAEAAPPPASEPTEAQLATARDAYARGQALFAESKYAEAKAAFEQAFAAVPNPVVLLSIAECQTRLGDFEAALETLQRYLAERPDAPDRTEVEQKIADLVAIPALLIVTSEPSGAQIALDGQSTGKVTPAEISVARGEHRIELTLPGHVTQSTPVTARIGTRHELHVALQPTPPPPPAPEVAEAAPASPGDQVQPDPSAALWITGIVGAAGIVTGTVLGFMTLAERSDFDANPTAESADRGERLALFTDVAFGVGAMALLTGVVIYLTAESAEPSEVAKPARLQIMPNASVDGAGVIAKTRF